MSVYKELEKSLFIFKNFNSFSFNIGL